MVDDLVSVPVPRLYLSRVYRLIADLDAKSVNSSDSSVANGTSREASEPSALVEKLTLDWTAKRILRMVQESPPAMRDILTLLAQRKDVWVPTEDLAAAIKGVKKANSSTVAGTLGAFGRRHKNRYGLSSPPFESRWDHALACKMYRMPGQISDDVLRMLNGK